MNFEIFQIPSVYTIGDGLSLKTISRYCPFNEPHPQLFLATSQLGFKGGKGRQYSMHYVTIIQLSSSQTFTL